MKDCELFDGEGGCEPQPDAECLGCILGMSDIEMKAFARFLEENQEGLRAGGLSLNTIGSILDAVDA